MTSVDLLGALSPVAQCFEMLGVRYYLTGSLASSAHGIARASLDVDLVAELDASHITPLASCLGDAYYLPLDRVRTAIEHRRSFNLIHFATMFKVDIFVSPRRAFDIQTADRARRELLDDAGGAIAVPTASAEDTLLAKLEWFRRGGESSERQWWDILGILRVAPSPDTTHLRRWAKELGVSDLLERALAEAEEQT